MKESVNIIERLIEKGEGEAIAALYHPSVGHIDVIWGQEGSGKSDGYGMAKLVKYHPEVINNLQEKIYSMKVTSRSENRVNLENERYQAAIRLTWDNHPKTWLLTAFEKKNSVPDNTTDTAKTNSGERNDTATPQNTVSNGKDTTVF